MHRAHLPIVLLSVLTLTLPVGCVQLIAFDQPIIGERDYEGPTDQHAGTVCDSSVEIGGSALCNSTCIIEGEETTCEERVTLTGRHAEVDVSGLHEVELTVTVCPRDGRTFRLAGRGDAALSFAGRALSVGTEEGTFLLNQPENLPEEECVERTIIIQDGRLALLDAGRRVCSNALPAFDQPWEIDMTTGVESLELCFRDPR